MRAMADGALTILCGDAADTVTATDGRVPADVLEALTGWALKSEGWCRGAVCVPVRDEAVGVVHPGGGGATVDLRAFAGALRLPLAIDGGIAVLAESAAARAESMASLEAPDFTLSDVNGEAHSLSDNRGKKRMLLTWASWCGCRHELPAWQALQQELEPFDFTIVAVALDSADEAREFIEAVAPSFVALVDPDHVVAERYGLVNVPSTVWIDENDHVVRAPDIAPGDDMFREFTAIDSSVHHAQLRDWVRNGVLPADEAAVRADQQPPSADEQLARVERRLAVALVRGGHEELAEGHFARASELAPLDWTINRGSMRHRGGDPFGQEFDFFEDWKAAGRPGYGRTGVDGEPL